MDNSNTLLMQLTAENPKWFYGKESDCHRNAHSTTKSRAYYNPERMVEWKDFNFASLRSLYGGSAIEILKQPNPKPLPTVPKTDLKIHDETSTAIFYTSWHREIVCAALLSSSNELHPCTWLHHDGFLDPLLVEKLDSETIEKITLKLKPAVKAKIESKHQSGRIGPLKYKRKNDLGSGVYCETCMDPVDFERLPKDYKFGKSWKSSEISKINLVDADGNWVKAKGKRSAAWPIKQVYTYCVDNLCRYGAILTTEEAFVFRIQPSGPQPDFEKDSAEELRELHRQLTEGGILEYASIQCASHWDSTMKEEGELTINLALWYLHVLAGNNHRTYWSLDDLASESLRACAGSACSATPHPDSAHVLTSHGLPVGIESFDTETSSSGSDRSTGVMHNSKARDKAKKTVYHQTDPRPSRFGSNGSTRTSSFQHGSKVMHVDARDALRDLRAASNSSRKRKNSESDPIDPTFTNVPIKHTGRKRRAHKDYSYSFDGVSGSYVSGRSSFDSRRSEVSSTNTTQPNTQTAV